jgi:hypothetical protein
MSRAATVRPSAIATAALQWISVKALEESPACAALVMAAITSLIGVIDAHTVRLVLRGRLFLTSLRRRPTTPQTPVRFQSSR